jgi:hypothetical protein
MPLPKGFKVNGVRTAGDGIPLPPMAQKIVAVLDKLPASELLTTAELAARVSSSLTGSTFTHPGLQDYRQQVDRNMFWGSRKSIAKLRKQLNETEEPTCED